MSTEKPSTSKIVRCPQCGHPSIFGPENSARPFCSERCQLIDLGQWAREDYKIPTEEPPDFDIPENFSEN